MTDIRSYIDDLFRYVDTYESRYAEFQTEAFLQTYNGIYAVFQALRQQRDEAVNIDQYILEKVRSNPLSSSDLRQLTIQILVSYFESEADVDGRSNQTYSSCRELRPVKQDVPYFENHLLDLLFREGSLNNNFRLNFFFLSEMVRFVRKFGKPLNAGITPEVFAGMREPLKIMELARRRLELGPDLIKDRSSLEFHLRQVEGFNKLAMRSRLNDAYLRHWDYLVTTSFWSRVKSYLAEVWGKIKGAFRSWRYFRLVITQRNPAYLFYGVIIVIMIAVAVLVPSWWGDYEDSQLEEFRERAQRIHRSTGR